MPRTPAWAPISPGSTASLILDLRGYPRGAIWAPERWLNTKAAKVGARFERPLVTSDPEPTRLEITQTTADGPVGDDHSL